MTTEETVTEITRPLSFATAAKRDAVQEFVESLARDPRIEASISVQETYEKRPKLPPGHHGIGVVEFFIIIAGAAYLVRLVAEIIEDLGRTGGTVIDASGDGQPKVYTDPNLPDDSVTILSTDEKKVTYTPQESVFETLMAVLKEVLISVLSGAKDKAKDIAEKIKDVVVERGGSEEEVKVS